MSSPPSSTLPRVVGIFGAVMMGLGSIIGAGVFVSIGTAAAAAGPAVVLAITVAAALALCNGLSSAQLAANHPVSGGTYEYGYRYLNAPLGFTAGWLFLCAKSASAATAAIGFAGYLLTALDVRQHNLHAPVAVAIVVLVMFLALAGLKRSNAANIAIVGLTLATLVFFIVICIQPAMKRHEANLWPFFGRAGGAEGHVLPGFLEACALMFVAYTGYGRIATLGEEIRQPKRNIPIAILVTLIVSMLLYIAVGLAGVAAVGVDRFGIVGMFNSAPLQLVAEEVAGGWAGKVLAVGAITAMFGVLLNLVLGLSRVALAMGRRGDLPARLAHIDPLTQTPQPAILLVSAIIVGLTLIGSAKTTWSFSAFTMLIYYAITNLAALRLPAEQRLYPRWIAVAGLVGCTFLAFWVQWQVWLSGLGLIAVGLAWHAARRKRQA